MTSGIVGVPGEVYLMWFGLVAIKMDNYVGANAGSKVQYYCKVMI